VQAGHAGFATITQDLRRTDVHPPLYFWAVAAWRRIAGDSLFGVRMLSVGFGVGALAAVGAIARRCGIPAATAMLLTLGCYGFAYTGAIARGFALAQMLTLIGIAVALSGRRFQAGAFLGAAVMTNYLAAFVAGTVVALMLYPGPIRPFPLRRYLKTWTVVAGFLPFLLVATGFFFAQRGSRSGQFPAFDLLPALVRLGRYSAANFTGGLPLYVPTEAQPVVAGALIGGLVGLTFLVVRHWRPIATPSMRILLLAAALAPPLGLIALGMVFDNTPIELRYLSFSTPFIALLVAGARPNRWVVMSILAVQTVSVAGLIARPETMQPIQAAATTAAALVEDGVVLVPLGNDGVGIVGSFASGLPPALPLLVIAAGDSPDDIRARVAPFHRVVLTLLTLDGASRIAVPAMRAAVATPDWRLAASGVNVAVYERIGKGV
jgi:hypothetical protein